LRIRPGALLSGLLCPAQATPLTSAADLAPTTCDDQPPGSTVSRDRGRRRWRGARRGGPRSRCRGALDCSRLPSFAIAFRRSVSARRNADGLA
jgi:hypothetical protein